VEAEAQGKVEITKLCPYPRLTKSSTISASIGEKTREKVEVSAQNCEGYRIDSLLQSEWYRKDLYQDKLAM